MSDVSRFTATATEVLVVIDSGVADFKLLAASVMDGAAVLVLDPDRNGIQQITEAQQRHHANILHIVSHGKPGCLYLGNTELNLGNLDRYTTEITQWFNASPAQLVLYGCNVAAGDAGSEFITKLQALTQADIAASTSLTGHAALGGNWNLELRKGNRPIALAFEESVQNWQGVLMPQTINPTGGTAANGSDGLRITIGATGQYQVLYQNSNQVYPGGANPPSAVDNNIFLAIGTTLIGSGTPTSGAGSLGLTRVWKGLSQSAVAGSGSSSNPYTVSTVVYDDINSNNTWDAASEVRLTFFDSYVAPEKYLYQSYTIDVPTSNTQPIKLYQVVDTFLAGGDNGPAYALDSAGNSTTSSTANTSLIGVIKNAGTATEVFEAFVELTPWDHWYSSTYNTPYSQIKNGGDLVDTFNGVASTDNGLAIQYNLGVATGTKFVENVYAFANAPTQRLDPASDTGIAGDSTTTLKRPNIIGKGVPAGSTVEVFAQGSTGAPVSLGFATVTGTTWSLTPTSNFADDTYTITAKVTSAGVVSNAFPFNLTIVTQTSILAPTSDSGILDNITNDNTPTITGTKGDVGATVTVKAQISGGPLVTLGTAVVAANGTWSITPSATLPDGVYSITTSSVLGGVTSTLPAYNVTIDTVSAAPTALDLATPSDTGISSTDNITSDNTPTITGSASPNSTVELFDGTTSLGIVTADASGNWSFTPTTALPDKVYNVTAKATDVAGNISPASALLAITIDTVAPAAPGALDLATPSDLGISSTDNITSDNTPTITGTAIANSQVELFDGTTSLGIVTADATGNWSFTPTTALPDKVYNVTAKQTDAAGNVSPASALLAITIDTTAPAAPGALDLATASDLGISSTDNITSDNTPTITGTAIANSQVELFDGTTSLGIVTADATGNWSFTPTTALPDKVLQRHR